MRELRSTHSGELPGLALAAMRDQQPLIAFAAADRWLRTAGPNIANLMVRAEASRLLGFPDFALADLSMVLQRDPFHRRANHRLANWGDPEQACAAARTLIGFSGPDAERGVRVLHAQGAKGAGLVHISGHFVEGWLAWTPEARAELVLAGAKSRRIRLSPEENCRWSDIFGAAATVRHELRDAMISRVALLLDGEEVAVARRAAPAFDDDTIAECARPVVTIIVPVYDDFDATRDCLVAAAAAIETVPNGQILIVDDASPNRRIKNFLVSFAAKPGRRLLVNPTNLGFVGAVNRGLRQTRSGDVLLLNADTLLPSGSLERFRDVAQSHPNVGIVNPLSNHGEFVSYPKPFRHNDFERIGWRITDAAAASAGDAAVDIPSGTGFCMYVTRACLDAVGELSEQFAEGYLEDADFGLRAREAGFRNVCAPSIYVPHLGSRSFKGAKAALVARNRLALARRFPAYEAECDAFVLADPLRRARARLELAQAGEAPGRRLVLVPSRFEPALISRAETLAGAGVGVLFGLIDHDARGFNLRLTAFDGKAPQNIILFEADGAEALFGALKRWPFDRIELVATPDFPALLRDRLRDFGAPVDIVAVSAIGSDASWRRAMASAERVFGIDALGRAYCDRLAGESSVAPSLLRIHPDPAASHSPPLLAIVYPYQTADSLKFLQKLSARARHLDLSMVLLGSTICDEKFIREAIFVTGPARQEERLRLIETYGVDCFLLPYRREGFWALETLLDARPRPAAYFDWSGAGFRFQNGDLALDVSCSDDEAADMLIAWLQSRQEGELASVEREVA